MELAFRSVVCLQPKLGSLTSLCGYISLSQEHESLWNGDGCCKGYLYTARPVALPYMDSGQECVEDRSANAHHRLVGLQYCLCRRGPDVPRLSKAGCLEGWTGGSTTGEDGGNSADKLESKTCR